MPLELHKENKTYKLKKKSPVLILLLDEIQSKLQNINTNLLEQKLFAKNKVAILRLRANGRNIVDQQLPTLLDVTCCVRLHTLLHVFECCCVLLRKV